MSDYRLLDSGFGRKLERIGPYLLDRQAPSAVWRPALSKRDWREAQGQHVRSDRGGGHWEWRIPEPEPWVIEHAGVALGLKPTPFGHLGIFAEHAITWNWLREKVRAIESRLGRPAKVLNLFAYTGGSSLAAAQAGAHVTHVDAARGVVDWARRNAEHNQLHESPIRWIVDDARKFTSRALKRGDFYDGIILDPPSFGRGKKGEVWKIEDDLHDLLDTIYALLQPSPGFLLFSCHTPGYTPIALENLLSERFAELGLEMSSGELTVPEEAGRRLPAGTYCRLD
jgi:23S rRNA (cytosine1962-C5)-methyltransferase